jgi:hypothetical protein
MLWRIKLKAYIISREGIKPYYRSRFPSQFAPFCPKNDFEQPPKEAMDGQREFKSAWDSQNNAKKFQIKLTKEHDPLTPCT